MTLSGGRKQRISLARALYHHANFYVLDDRGLDADTELEVFIQTLGPSGLLNTRCMSSVVLATHNIRFLPMAQHIIVLSVDDTIAYEGDYAGLAAAGLYQQSGLSLGLTEAKKPLEQNLEQEKRPEPILPHTLVDVLTSGTSFSSERERMTGDFTVYRYYLKSLGKVCFVAFALFGIGWGFF
ncbi:hypothetical protein jhhlp_003378 [Lomentospora prolificans]|uniref:ABC transporter domain-containing protein n=1 Tax=Lomentospora prolificans TaxID=41688 RepID=A0A2N3NCD8_9PEZI|nr:hypothetical protein jhhlp_003378 [Lomentospora prolificans]